MGTLQITGMTFLIVTLEWAVARTLAAYTQSRRNADTH